MEFMYRVTFAVELNAESYRGAAEQAREIMRDPRKHGITESYEVQQYYEDRGKLWLGAARHINLELPELVAVGDGITDDTAAIQAGARLRAGMSELSTNPYDWTPWQLMKALEAFNALPDTATKAECRAAIESAWKAGGYE